MSAGQAPIDGIYTLRLSELLIRLLNAGSCEVCGRLNPECVFTLMILRQCWLPLQRGFCQYHSSHTVARLPRTKQRCALNFSPGKNIVQISFKTTLGEVNELVTSSESKYFELLFYL